MFAVQKNHSRSAARVAASMALRLAASARPRRSASATASPRFAASSARPSARPRWSASATAASPSARPLLSASATAASRRWTYEKAHTTRLVPVFEKIFPRPRLPHEIASHVVRFCFHTGYY